MSAKRNDNTEARSIITVRVLNAPKDLVFSAFTDAKHMRHWFGPFGFTMTVKAFDFKVGGSFKYIFHGPDGTDYDNHITYKEINPTDLIRYVHGGDGGGDADVQFDTTVRFEDLGKQTRVTLTGVFASAEERNRVAEKYGAVEGAKQTLTRLDEYVGKVQKGGGLEPYVIRRTFKAPRELMFNVWSKPEHVKNWLGPKGSKMTYSKADIRPGGTHHYCMQYAGTEIWGMCRYEEIQRPEKMVWVQWFSNKEGGMGRHPMAPTWPKEMHTTVLFTELNGQTTVHLEWIPLNATPEELAMFEQARPGMNQGWGGNFDVLEDYLKGLQA